MIQGTDPATRLRALAGRRGLARAALLFEQVWPAIQLPLAVIGIFLCLALLNVLPMLPNWLHACVLGLTLGSCGVLFYRGLHRIRLPDDGAADRRLEASSGLHHDPLAVLTDQPATGDMAVWRAHTARALAQIGRLRVGLPRPRAASRDPHALRYGLLMVLVACMAIANVNAPARLFAALFPALPIMAGAPATQLQAWITPPAYTRIAPIFLKTDVAVVSVPAGSQLTVNVSGGSGTPALSMNDRAGRFQALDHDSFQAELDLTRGGVLTVTRGGDRLASWSLTVIVDQPPTVGWNGAPGRSASGQQTRLPWSAADDYGVTDLRAELHLRDRPDAPPLIVPIPLPGGSPKNGRGLSQPDLTANPWAGLPVIGHLIGRDAIGQTGTSADASFEIGERPFHNPVARILIAARKTLTVHPADRTDALAALDGLMQQPELFKNDPGAFLNLSATYYLLVRQPAPEAIPEGQDMLWQLALHMEEGQTERTARALEEARQAARDALDRATRQPTDANRQALEKRLAELRQAIDRHMQAMMQDAMRNNTVAPFDPQTAQMSNRDMDRMAQQAEQAAREGRMADAQQQMQQLEKLLDRLRNAQSQSQASRQANSQRQRGKQQMGAVQDLIGREGGLTDHAQRRADAAAPPTTDPDQERQADGRTQKALRDALDELMQQFADLTGKVAPSLGEADQAMRQSQSSLGKADDEAANAAQQKAIAALQRGGSEMAQAMSRQQGGQSGQDGDDDGQDGQGGMMGMMMPGGQSGEGRGGGPYPGSPDQADSSGRDPLGRYNQGSSTDSADVTVPSDREHQRTQAIQQELRKREAEQDRPRQELDYIDRLLKQF